MPSDPLGQFKKQQYINLETYRKTGAGVRTPVWFVQEGSTLFVWTSGVSGKAKRIRNNAQVKVAPCDQSGNLKGTFVSGTAQIYPVGTPTFEHGRQLMDKKYGLMKKLIELVNRGDKSQRVVIEIALNL